MADTVQYLMEEMVPELEDLAKKYFTKGEVKAIVQKRQNFEYQLKRRAPIKADFLRCTSSWAAWIASYVASLHKCEIREHTRPV